MKVFVDMNNLAVRCIFSTHVAAETDLDAKYQVWRYTVFNSLISSIRRFRATEVVLGIDFGSWRKEHYPPYKLHRSKLREEQEFDWSRFYNEYNSFVEKLKTLPFKIIQIELAEGDDILGVLALNIKENCTIISTDKDFQQLCCERIRIYDPLKQSFIENPDPNRFLLTEILTGQAKDNIFNIKTKINHPDDVRKPPFGDKKAEKIMGTDGLRSVSKWLLEQEDWVKERFETNKLILDLRLVPNDIKSKIMNAYLNYTIPSPENIWPFIKEQGWPSFVEDFTNLENTLLRLY